MLPCLTVIACLSLCPAGTQAFDVSPGADGQAQHGTSQLVAEVETNEAADGAGYDPVEYAVRQLNAVSSSGDWDLSDPDIRELLATVIDRVGGPAALDKMLRANGIDPALADAIYEATGTHAGR